MSNQDIKSFLTQPENLGLALEIADYVEDIKNQTHHAFWPGFNISMSRLLAQSPYTGRWNFAPFDLRHLKKDLEKCWIQPINRKNTLPLLQFGIGQASQENNYRLYCGVMAYNATYGEAEQPGLTRLKAELIASELTIVEPNWLGWNFLPIIPKTEDFINGMFNRPETYVQECAQLIWDLFMKLQPHIDAVNDIRSQVTG